MKNFFLVFLDFFLCSFHLTEEGRQGKSIELLDSSSEDEDEEHVDKAGEDSDKNGSDSSGSGSDVAKSSEQEETSPKVDITY
jgi:hypothetical protein